MKQKREILETYFKTGDRPTQEEFKELIDSYAHLNEFNFGLTVKPSGQTFTKYYHFYRAINVQTSGSGHKIIEDAVNSTPPSYTGYNHLFSQGMKYKKLEVKLIGEIDVALHQPKMIIERYKQRKKLNSGYIKPAGFYKEKAEDAALWNRKSEYEITSNETTIDLEPIRYFRPNHALEHFLPSGSLSRQGSFKYSRHTKPFVPIRLSLQINIEGVEYISRPTNIKIILGLSESDAINFVFD